MKVFCKECHKDFASIGFHLSTFKNPETDYVCLVCTVYKQEALVEAKSEGVIAGRLPIPE
jgi:hypothetical protein